MGWTGMRTPWISFLGSWTVGEELYPDHNSGCWGKEVWGSPLTVTDSRGQVIISFSIVTYQGDLWPDGFASSWVLLIQRGIKTE